MSTMCGSSTSKEPLLSEYVWRSVRQFLINEILCKLTVVQGKKSSAMVFCTIITVVFAIAATTTAVAVVSSHSTSSQSNQTASNVQQTNQQPYNATEYMISAFKTADSLLIQALNDLNMGKTQEAHTQLSMAKTQIEQYQLASLDAMSNPVLQLSRGHLLAAEQALKVGNTDQAISELNVLRQVRLLHQQGMMIMKLPMAGELNSTFNSLESHLLTADENINGYNIRGAISELNLANDQLYAHQLAMLNVVYQFFNNTRTHLKQSIDDLNSGNTQGTISELKIVDNLLRVHEQGMLMMVGSSNIT
ncbi:MAG: hypothetical protein WA667_11590 [Candidatus Nitrosopolaris sp.]